MLNLNKKQKKFENIVNDLSDKSALYYLLTGKTKEEPYKREYKIIYRLINLRYDTETIEQFFKVFACNNTYFRSQKINSFRSSLHKAIVHYNNHKSDFDYECDDIIEHLHCFKALSVYERIVFKTILKIAKKVGQFEKLYLSIYRIAKEAGITSVSAHNNLQQLCDKKLLIKIAKRNKNKPAIYTINKGPILKSISSNKEIKTTNTLIQSNKVRMNSDLFDHSRLGKTGYLVLNFFIDNFKKSYSIGDIATILGISYNTVKKKIRYFIEEEILVEEKIKVYKKPKNMYRIDIEKFNKFI